MDNPKETVLESAKKGNVKAIKALINKALLSRGISVTEVILHNKSLTIKLRHKTGVLNDETLQRIKLSAQKLAVQSVENVEVIDVTQIKSEPITSSLPQAKSTQKTLSQPGKSVPRISSSQTKISSGHSKNNKFQFSLGSLLSRKNLFIAGGTSGVGFVSIVAFLFLGPASICKVDGQPAYELFQQIDSEWSDSVELAHNTSRMSLSLVVQKTQSDS
ncbi:MAG: hypothetical protein AAFR58_11035 [Cyanobacteria bacterium J06627_28]